MKYKRSERLVVMTSLLRDHPHHKYTIKDFQDRFQTAKSSISEDFAIINRTFQDQGWGHLEMIQGAGGGCIYHPATLASEGGLQADLLTPVLEALASQDRLLPGGYIYLTDLLGDPDLLRLLGQAMACRLEGQSVDYILTVASKGIPVAQALAYALDRPFVIASKESRVTEGATLSVKYLSDSAPGRIQRMEVVSDRIPAGANLVLVDDFYRGGGTMRGMASLAKIFGAEVVGQFVFCANRSDLAQADNQPVSVESLVTIDGLLTPGAPVTFHPGSLFDH